MSFEETIRSIVREVVEQTLSAHDDAIADKVAARLGRVDSVDFLTVTEAATRARVEPATIREWIKERRLRAHRAGSWA